MTEERESLAEFAMVGSGDMAIGAMMACDRRSLSKQSCFLAADTRNEQELIVQRGVGHFSMPSLE